MKQKKIPLSLQIFLALGLGIAVGEGKKELFEGLAIEKLDG